MNRAEHYQRQFTEAFKKAHHEGAEEFGGLWLQANDSAINRVQDIPADLTKPETKALVSVVILSVLRTCRAANE